MLPQRRQSPTTGIARELFCKRTSRPHRRPIGNILNVYLSIVSAEPWSKEAKGPHRRFLSNMFGQSSQLIGSIYFNLYMYTRGRASEGRAQSLQLDSSPHGLLSECFAWSGAATVSLQNLLTNASAAALMDSSVCSPTLLASSCVRCPSIVRDLSVIASPIIRDGIAPAFTLRRGGLVAGVDVVEGCGCSRDASNVWSRGAGSPRVAGRTTVERFPIAKEALAICNCGARGFGTHGLASTIFVCVAWSQAMPAAKASFCNEPAYVCFVASPQEKHFDPSPGYHICQ